MPFANAAKATQNGITAAIGASLVNSLLRKLAIFCALQTHFSSILVANEDELAEDTAQIIPFHCIISQHDGEVPKAVMLRFIA